MDVNREIEKRLQEEQNKNINVNKDENKESALNINMYADQERQMEIELFEEEHTEIPANDIEINRLSRKEKDKIRGRKGKTYGQKGVGLKLSQVDRAQADKAELDMVKNSLKEYLDKRKVLFDEEGNPKNDISEPDKEAVCKAYDELDALVRAYLDGNSERLKYGKGKKQIGKIESIKNLISIDNRMFNLSIERRTPSKSLDAQNEGDTGFPTLLKAAHLADGIMTRNQLYDLKRKQQEREGETPGRMQRYKEWWKLAGRNNLDRLKMVYHIFGGLTERGLGLATMLASNTAVFAGKVAKTPIKILSLLCNGVSKAIHSKKRWNVDYSFTRGWVGMREGRQILRDCAKGLAALPVGTYDALVHGFPYLCRKISGNAKKDEKVFRTSAKLMGGVGGRMVNIVKSLGIAKEYDAVVTGDDTEILENNTVNRVKEEKERKEEKKEERKEDRKKDTKKDGNKAGKDDRRQDELEDLFGGFAEEDKEEQTLGKKKEQAKKKEVKNENKPEQEEKKENELKKEEKQENKENKRVELPELNLVKTDFGQWHPSELMRKQEKSPEETRRLEKALGKDVQAEQFRSDLEKLKKSDHIKGIIDNALSEKELEGRINDAYNKVSFGKKRDVKAAENILQDTKRKLAIQKHLISEGEVFVNRRKDESKQVSDYISLNNIEEIEKRIKTEHERDALRVLLTGKNNKGLDILWTVNIRDIDVDMITSALGTDISEFKYASDEEFVSNYAKKYHKLCRLAEVDVLAQRLVYVMNRSITEVRIISGLARSLKKEYEDRYKLISSPYYALIPEDELKAFLGKDGKKKISKVKDRGLADFLNLYREVENNKTSSSKEAVDRIINEQREIQKNKDIPVLRSLMKQVAEGQDVTKDDGIENWDLSYEDKCDNLKTVYMQQIILESVNEAEDDVKYVNKTELGNMGTTFLLCEGDGVGKFEKMIAGSIKSGKIFGVKIAKEHKSRIQDAFKKWVSKRREFIRAKRAYNLVEKLTFAAGCDMQNEAIKGTEEAKWLSKFDDNRVPDQIFNDYRKYRENYEAAFIELFGCFNSLGYPMSQDRKYENRLEDKTRIKAELNNQLKVFKNKKMGEDYEFPVVTVNGKKYKAYPLENGILHFIAGKANEYKFAGSEGKRIDKLLKRLAALDEKRMVLDMFYDGELEKYIIYHIRMKEIADEREIINNELLPLLAGKVEGIEEMMDPEMQADLEDRKKYPALNDIDISPKAVKKLPKDADFFSIINVKGEQLKHRALPEAFKIVPENRLVQSPDGKLIVKGLRVNRIMATVLGKFGQQMKDEEWLDLFKKLDGPANKEANNLSAEEAQKQFDEALIKLKGLYYAHMKRVESTYGRKLTQMHPHDVLRMMGDRYAEVKDEFEIIQDLVQLTKDGKKYFDPTKKEDRDFINLLNYYNSAFSQVLFAYGAGSEKSAGNGKYMPLSAKQLNDMSEKNEGNAKEYSYVKETDIHGPSLTPEEQEAYIKDVQKRAAKEGWSDRLFGRYSAANGFELVDDTTLTKPVQKKTAKKKVHGNT